MATPSTSEPPPGNGGLFKWRDINGYGMRVAMSGNAIRVGKVGGWGDLRGRTALVEQPPGLTWMRACSVVSQESEWCDVEAAYEGHQSREL